MDQNGGLTAKDIITLAIAAYAALLSTFNLIQSIVKEQRRVSVEWSTAFYTSRSGDVGPPMLSLEVMNHGHRSVVVQAPSLRLPNGQSMVLLKADGFEDFPKRLEDGEKVGLRMSYEMLCDALKINGYSQTVKLRPVCADNTGKKHWGKKIKIDPNLQWDSLP